MINIADRENFLILIHLTLPLLALPVTVLVALVPAIPLTIVLGSMYSPELWGIVGLAPLS